MSDFDLTKHLADKVEKLEWRAEKLEQRQKGVWGAIILIAMFLLFRFFI